MNNNMIRILATALFTAILLSSALMLSGCDIDWDYCQHTLEEVEKQESSCMKVGKKTAYKCTKCGELFAYGYLNGTDGEKGIYSITSQEMLDYSDHKIGGFFGDLKSDMPSFEASSLEDYTVWSTCSEEGCGEHFEVPEHNLVAFTPSDNTSGKAQIVTQGENTEATRFTINKGTTAGDRITIYTGGSKLNNATNKIPFTANTDRHVVLFFHNDGNQDVQIRYGTEFYGERVGVDVTVPAHGYAAGYFNLNITQSNADCYHELYVNTNVEETFNLTISGFYYHEAKLQNIKITGYPQTEYAIGETLNLENLEITATFGGIDRKVKAGDYTVLLNNNKPADQPLTADDNKVYVIYQNKQVEFDIVVKRFEQNVALSNATFADGSSNKVLERNSILPTDIRSTDGKAIGYFIDQYGAKYVPGESKIPAYNVTLTAIPVGIGFSDNYAAGQKVTASSTSHGGNVNKLTDGVHGLNSEKDDRWSSSSNYDTATPAEADRQWVTVNLGTVKSISCVVLYPRVWGSYFPEGYEIYVSANGNDWDRVVSVENDELASQNSTNARWNVFDSVDAQYVKIVATKMTNDNGSYGYIFQLSEIEIFGTVSND
jgi:hypothetical protein